jgi:hypothetical protein
VLLLVAVMFAAFPAMFPVTWLPGSDKADSVTSVELLVAVILLAVPVVFWLRVGMSAGTMRRKVGAPADPLGAAKNVLAALDWNEAKVRVPAVVTGLPVMLNKPVESAKPTEVTVPEPPPPPVEEIVRVPVPGVRVMLLPARRVSAPVMPFRLVTPPEEPGPVGYVA